MSLAALIDIPEVPFISTREQLELDEAMSDEDRLWERRYGVNNQARSSLRSYSLGLLCLGTVLKEKGYGVAHVDYRDLHTSKAVQAIGEADYLMVSLISPFRPILSKLTTELQMLRPGCRLILGGFGPTYEPEAFLRICPPGSVAVMREGEVSVFHAIEYINDGNLRPGLAVLRDDGRIEYGPPVPLIKEEQIPLPDYSLVEPVDRFRTGVSTIRGCPGACLFCSGTPYWRSIRARPVKSVLQELDYLNRHLAPGTLVHFCDNVVTFNRERFLSLSGEIAKRNYQIDFSCDVRSDSIDVEIALALKRGRFKRVCVGIEDCDDNVLELGKKGITFSQSRAALETLRHYTDCYITAYWLIGLPGTTDQTVQKNLQAIHELILGRLIDQTALSIFKPYPGCEGLNGQVILERTWEDFLRDMEYPMYRLRTMDSATIARSVTAYKRTVLEASRKRAKAHKGI